MPTELTYGCIINHPWEHSGLLSHSFCGSGIQKQFSWEILVHEGLKPEKSTRLQSSNTVAVSWGWLCCPQGTLDNVWRHIGLSPRVWCKTTHLGREVRDVVKSPSALESSTHKNDPAPNVKNAEAEKPWSTGWTELGDLFWGGSLMWLVTSWRPSQCVVAGFPSELRETARWACRQCLYVSLLGASHQTSTRRGEESIIVEGRIIKEFVGIS